MNIFRKEHEHDDNNHVDTKKSQHNTNTTFVSTGHFNHSKEENIRKEQYENLKHSQKGQNENFNTATISVSNTKSTR